MTPPNGHPDPNKWWLHARYMAYTCLAAMILFPFAAGWAPNGAAMADVAWPFYIGTSGVVAVYTGGVAVSWVKR